MVIRNCTKNVILFFYVLWTISRYRNITFHYHFLLWKKISVFAISIVKNLQKKLALWIQIKKSYVFVSVFVRMPNISFTAKETIVLLYEAFPDTILSKSQVYKWYKKFQSGRTSIEDDPHPGCLRTSTKNDSCDWVLQIVKSDRRLGIQKITAHLAISFELYQSVLADTRYHKIVLKFVPLNLIQEQKETCVSVSELLVELGQFHTAATSS